MADLCKILLADDNPKYMEEVLPYYGYEVICASNGEEALEILHNDKSIDIGSFGCNDAKNERLGDFKKYQK